MIKEKLQFYWVWLKMKTKCILVFLGIIGVVMAAPLVIPQHPIGEAGPAVFANEDILEKRNLNSKHIDNGDGTFTMAAHIAHIHFLNDDNELENIDCRFTPRAYGGWEMRANNYELEIPAKANGWFKFINSFGYDSRGKARIDKPDEVVAFRPLGVESVSGIHRERPEWKGKGIVLYPAAYGIGIDLEVMARNTGFVKEVVINKKPSDLSQDLEFAFEIDLGDKQVKPKKADYMSLREQKIAEFKGLKGKELLELQKTYEDDLEREIWNKQKVLETSDSIILQKLRKTWFRKFNLYDSEGNHGFIKVRLENIDGKIILTKVLDKRFLENAVYPVRTDTTTSYYAGAGDGTVVYNKAGSPSQINWNTAHNAATGTSSTYSGSIIAQVMAASGAYLEIKRAFYPVNTDGLPDDAVISAAILKTYMVGKEDDYNGDGYDYVAVVQTDQPSTSVLANADYNNCGTTDNPTKGSANIDISGLSTGSYQDLTLNETGRGWINKTGYTMLGVREGHDIQDNYPGSTTAFSLIESRNSAYTTTAQDPYISITYTVGGARRIIITQ